MYSLLLGRVRASFIDGNFEQRKVQSRFGGPNLFSLKWRWSSQKLPSALQSWVNGVAAEAEQRMVADGKQTTLLHASLIQSMPCGCSDSVACSIIFFLWSHWMQGSADLFRLKLHISRIFSYTTNREGPVVFWLFAYIKTAWICFRFFFFSLKALHLVKKVRHQMLSRTVLLKKSNLEYLHNPYQLQKIFFFSFFARWQRCRIDLQYQYIQKETVFFV